MPLQERHSDQRTRDCNGERMRHAAVGGRERAVSAVEDPADRIEVRSRAAAAPANQIKPRVRSWPLSTGLAMTATAAWAIEDGTDRT